MSSRIDETAVGPRFWGSVRPAEAIEKSMDRMDKVMKTKCYKSKLWVPDSYTESIEASVVVKDTAPGWEVTIRPRVRP